MRRRTGLLALVALCNTLFVCNHAITVSIDGQPGESCEMGGGVMGTCEDVGKCLESGGVVRREGVVKICSREFPTIYVCCRRPHIIAKELCDAWSQYWRQDEGGCATEHQLIVGGETANVGEFPHVALLRKRYRSRYSDDCGGTLVSPHFVLTAAHCLFTYVKGVTYWVKLGEHDLEHDASEEVIEILQGPIPASLYGADNLTSDLDNATTNSGAPVEQLIQVEEQFIYPTYSEAYHYNDIALLRLKTPAKLTKRVLPACLPYQYPAVDYQEQKMTVVGWGQTSGGRGSRTLQKVDIPVIDRLSCSATDANYRKTPQGITEDMLCAGQKNRDSCSGDSGGPLSFQKPRNSSSCEHTIVGVVSYGLSTCSGLGVYTRVSSFLDWITGYIAPNGTSYFAEDDDKPLNNTGYEAPTQNVSSNYNTRGFSFPEENENTVSVQKTTQATTTVTTSYIPRIIFGDFP